MTNEMNEAFDVMSKQHAGATRILFGDWKVTPGKKITFSCVDSSSARSLMIDVLMNLVEDGVSVHLMSLDRTLVKAMSSEELPNASSSMFTHYDDDNVVVVDLTSEDGNYPAEIMEIVDGVTNNERVTVIVFEKQSMMRSRSFTVDSIKTRTASENLDVGFVVTGPTNESISRVICVMCYLNRECESAQGKSILMSEVTSRQIDVVSVLDKRESGTE